MEKLKSIRDDYGKSFLSEEDLTANPLDLMQVWMDKALESDELEPTCVHLATVDPTGQPSLRVVLLKGFDARGFQFFTNYDSKKGKEIATNDKVAISILWKTQQRQVRIEGRAEKMPFSESEAYFQSRPKESQIGAWSSFQSETLDDRNDLVNRYKSLEAQYKNDDVLPCPPNWGGYIVIPSAIEFWQGRMSRLHDRFRYEHSGGEWKWHRLWP